MIKLITLKTNHTILGDLVDEDGIKVKIKQPVQVVTVPPRSQTDSGGIAFSPFLEYCQEFRTGIEIQKHDILVMSSPIVELENQYNAIFGSGIQIAKTL